ncbi:MAG: hypothetical protein HY268_20615 [Deltaproteobacteria bacterium]|nr:hypothetical protein [Deltaproteobacteria bacterium]
MSNEETKKLIEAMTEVFPTAEMVQRGFENVDKRFEQIDARFEQIDARFEQIDARFEKVDARLAHIDARLDTIERDIRDLVHREEFTDLMARVKYIEEKLNIESGK